MGLTEAGDALLPYAKRTIEDADNCVYKMNDLMNMKCGTLNIGVTHSFRILTSDTINVFVKKFPNIKLNIFYKTNDELQNMLFRKEIDIMLAFKPETIAEQIESHNLFEDKLCAIVAKDHVLAQKSSITMEEIAEQANKELDHIHIPDPVAQELRRLEERIAELEAELKKKEE